MLKFLTLTFSSEVLFLFVLRLWLAQQTKRNPNDYSSIFTQTVAENDVN
jgi:hypothetical protein